MAHYKLTLTKIDTGEVLVDEEIDCLVGGAASHEKDNSIQMLYSECNSITLSSANVAAQKVIQRLESGNPIVKCFTEMVMKNEGGLKNE